MATSLVGWTRTPDMHGAATGRLLLIALGSAATGLAAVASPDAGGGRETGCSPLRRPELAATS